MSSIEDRLRWRASPARARSLFTVRAAISSASSSDEPRSSRPSLMCSNWRSRFGDQAGCGISSLRCGFVRPDRAGRSTTFGVAWVRTALQPGGDRAGPGICQPAGDSEATGAGALGDGAGCGRRRRHDPQERADDRARIGPALVRQDGDREPVDREVADRAAEAEQPAASGRGSGGRRSTAPGRRSRTRRRAVVAGLREVAEQDPGPDRPEHSPPYSARAQWARSALVPAMRAGPAGGGHDRPERRDPGAVARSIGRAAGFVPVNR